MELRLKGVEGEAERESAQKERRKEGKGKLQLGLSLLQRREEDKCRSPNGRRKEQGRASESQEA